jgi:hypothetical protein
MQNIRFTNNRNYTPTTVKGHKLGDWVQVDLSHKNLISKGYKPKRNYNEIHDLKLVKIHSQNEVECYFGSNHRILLPFDLIPNKK